MIFKLWETNKSLCNSICGISSNDLLSLAKYYSSTIVHSWESQIYDPAIVKIKADLHLRFLVYDLELCFGRFSACGVYALVGPRHMPCFVVDFDCTLFKVAIKILSSSAYHVMVGNALFQIDN